MHIFILVLISFWTAQPAAGGKPVQPESAHTATAILFSEADCEALGEADRLAGHAVEGRRPCRLRLHPGRQRSGQAA